ncbi:MAG: aldo/keto reductase [Peptostreptococcaceae bacterium]|jgi:aryl-alcohol dehydrogenase-like predicted oxidoreductase|nr:aldo/keto reductase [Peptostreptococcaceae bacterium]
MKEIRGCADLVCTNEYMNKKKVKNFSRNALYAISKIGCGTYLGDTDKKTDLMYKNAIEYAISNGVNIIDTAINYRGMRSEVIVGEVLKELILKKIIKRSEIIVATKGGYLPADFRKNNQKESLEKSVQEERIAFFENNILPNINYDKDYMQGIINRGNTLSKDIIKLLFEESKKNLGLETIDLYYLHNPEYTKAEIGEELFYEKLYETFLYLEEQIENGSLKYYGISTYGGFIVDEDKAEYLSLEKIMYTAEKAGGFNNNLKFIQLPFNKDMRNAGILKNQKIQDKIYTTLEAAKKLNLNVMTNISLNQGKSFPKYSSEDMIKFLIDNKNICSAMIGMKNINNVEKNLKLILEK